MATPSLARYVQQRRWLRLTLWISASVLSLIVAAALVGGVWMYWSARRALPQLDGAIVVGGLSAPVNVVRDKYGVPHITAETLEDLFFAQGYVTAQDRLWQMDISRRAAAGELADVFGEELVKHDTRQRILLLRQVAERSAAELRERGRTHMEAYARGVNAYIAASATRLPIEFRLLRYQPKPWKVADSFLIIALMSQVLNHGFFRDELRREKIVNRIGPELTAELYPNSSWRDIPPGGKTGSRTQSNHEKRPISAAHGVTTNLRPPGRPTEGGCPHAGSAPLASICELAEPFLGSNNWVLSGEHTASAKPLLANDMHLPHAIPNTWYETHLRSGEFDVAGVTLPGVPYVVVGHNQRIAWGFTNLGPDVEDIYIESFNERGEYQTPRGWQLPEKRRETIQVRGSKPVEVEIVLTRHGPLVTDLVPGETRAIALKWIIYQPGSLTAPMFEVNTAQNWEQFRSAFSKFAGPAQNVVYADIDGHIGYQATGRIPIRASGYDGSLPVPGNTDAFEWTGYVPFEQLPSVYDPPSGILATANGRVTGDAYSNSLSTQWGPPYRTERIYRVLQAPKQFTTTDMLTLQTDVYSSFEHFVAQRLAYAVDQSSAPSARTREAADLLRAWDGQVEADSAAAAIAAVARQELVRLILEPKLGGEYEKYSWFMSSVWLENLLLKKPAHWLPEKYPTYSALLTAALQAAVDHEGAPRNLKNWTWGEQFPLELQHPVLGWMPILRRWTGPGRIPQSGSGYTVKQVGRTFGPSQRMTVDLSDLDSSTMNILTGQSGHIASEHYMDHWPAWYEGYTFPFPFSPKAIEEAASHRLVLMPHN